MKTTVRFTKKPASSAVLADAAIEFHADAGPLDGFEINGLAIWMGKDGKLFCTMPSRQYTDKTGAKKYYDYLRLRKEPDIEEGRQWAVKNWVIKEYERQFGREASDSQEDNW